MPEPEILTSYLPDEIASVMAARQEALPGELRRLHRAILTHFPEHGCAPDWSWLQSEAGALGLDPRAACARLAADDLVHLGDDCQVSVAYPFSGTPSGHRVHLAGCPPVWAMCAVDALGIPQMTGRDGVITAADPYSGEPVRVEVSGGRWHWRPPATTVLMTQPGEDVPEPAAHCACPHVNFVTRPGHAAAYLAGNPGLAGQLLGQDAAIELAGAVFTPLLSPSR